MLVLVASMILSMDIKSLKWQMQVRYYSIYSDLCSPFFGEPSAVSALETYIISPNIFPVNLLVTRFVECSWTAISFHVVLAWNVAMEILPLNLGKITTNGGLSNIMCHPVILRSGWATGIGVTDVFETVWRMTTAVFQCFTFLFSKTCWRFPRHLNLGVRIENFKLQVSDLCCNDPSPLSRPRLCNPGKLVSMGKDEKRGTMISVRFQWSEVKHEKSHASWCVPCVDAWINQTNVILRALGYWPGLNFLDVLCVKLCSFTLLWGALKEQPIFCLEGIESLSMTFSWYIHVVLT